MNGLNQYTSAGPAAFGYDANGNLTSDGSTTMVYDAENRLVSASGATPASLSYDPMGRLFQTSGGTPGTTQFLYDGDELVAEYNASGTMLRRYVHGLGTDDPILWYEGATLTQRRSLQADHQGSIIGVADSQGASIAINAYDAWGIPNATNLGRFQYTGQIFLPELGMYHYKARLYSPTLGRFLAVDPVGYDDQINLYAYVGNDPVNAVDPTGMEECPDTPDPEEICVPGKREQHKPESSAPPMPKPDLATVNVPGANERGAESVWPPQAPQCSELQLLGQKLGRNVSEIRSKTTLVGLGITGVGLSAAGAGVLTGNVPLAGAGLVIVGRGGELTAVGGLIFTGGAIVSAASGSGKDGAVELSTRLTTARLPEGPLKDSLSEALSRLLQASVPQFGTCQP